MQHENLDNPPPPILHHHRWDREERILLLEANLLDGFVDRFIWISISKTCKDLRLDGILTPVTGMFDAIDATI